MRSSRGFSYVELLIVVVISGMISLALMGLVDTAADSSDTVVTRNELNSDASFAMQQMVKAVSHTRLLMIPQPDKAYSNWPEHIREETVPPSPPIGDSTKSTAVLAVTLPLYFDMDGDGFPDADDDRDGRIDEDLFNDRNNDFAGGIYLIDDDNDGSVDENPSYWWDDDEATGVYDEDPEDGIDNDGDGAVDEDPSADMNDDGCPGTCGVDDDGDGDIDEGDVADDDEDGQENEDWYNPLVFYLNNGVLVQRTPVPWDISGGGIVGGQDFVTTDIAQNVTRFRVERIDTGNSLLVDLILELTDPLSGESVSLQTSVRVGGAL